MKHKRLFIVVDGPEGAGKSMLIRRAATYLESLVLPFIVTHEPGGTPYGKEIRDLILYSPHAVQADGKTLFALFWADRADHMKNKIIPALEEGVIVICDRFDSATFAYQIVAQGERELESLFWETRESYLGKFEPDMYVHVKLDPGIGLARKKEQGEENHIERKGLEFHRRVSAGLEEFFSRLQPEKVAVIDGSLDKEATWLAFKAVLDSLLFPKSD
ncbi:MAG: dTMP kinase [Patescibacteria group bacterium]|nr:dTMP kinase [Patescibacteria group bacterium]MDE1945800.1 dTMP kinase [Patescibacteria group bacterium]